MDNDQKPLKIIIPVEEEVPFVPERPDPKIKAKMREAGKQIVGTTSGAVTKAWQSEARKKATSGVKRGANSAVNKGGRIVQNAIIKTTERQAKKTATTVRNRIQSTQWKEEAKIGTAKGLQWLSHRLAEVADRFSVAEQNSPDKDTTE